MLRALVVAGPSDGNNQFIYPYKNETAEQLAERVKQIVQTLKTKLDKITKNEV